MRVVVDKLSKSFGRVAALRDATLTAERGEIVALVGANGAGKTTLLRALAGIVAPDAGEIRYGGELFTRDRLDLRRRFFFLSDEPPVIPAMTVLRHISMVVKLYGAERPELEDEVLALLGEFDILPMIESPLASLSRGQVYKACLAALLPLACDLWLFDEPFGSGLDPQGLAVLRRHIRAAADRGATVIYSTQLLEMAATLSDRVCVIAGGRVAAVEPIATLKAMAGTDRALHGLLESLDATEGE